MGTTGNLTVAGNGLSAGASIGGAIANYGALNSRSKYALQEAQFNNEAAMIEQADALKSGDIKAANTISQGRQIVGSQRASAAAQGVDVNSGSVSAATADTQQNAEANALIARNNAWRQAWGIGVSASDQNYQARFSALNDRGLANMTLLTGGLNAVGYALRSTKNGQQSQLNDQTSDSGSSYENLPYLDDGSGWVSGY